MKPWKDTPETCATCAFKHPQALACRRTGENITLEHYCAEWTDELFNCEICGNPIAIQMIWESELTHDHHLICPECFRSFSTCRMCASGKHCAFEADTTLPKQVMQTIRQGNMVMQTQIRNPELVKKTCEAGCKCYDKAGQYCRREDGYCVEHDFQSPF